VPHYNEVPLTKMLWIKLHWQGFLCTKIHIHKGAV